MRRLLNLEVILGLLCVAVLVIATQDPFGWAESESESEKPDWHSANCYKIPKRYHGGLYCSDQETGGDHGYVNPGSMEWEVE